MYLLFYYYLNPTDQKATGVRCDNDNNNGADLCDLVLEICVSKIGSRLVIVYELLSLLLLLRSYLCGLSLYDCVTILIPAL